MSVLRRPEFITNNPYLSGVVGFYKVKVGDGYGSVLS